jgi:hypothetical protein
MTFKNSVRTSKKTQHFTIKKINWLMLYREIIAVYSEIYKKQVNKFCGQNLQLLNAKGGGANQQYRWKHFLW